jgi:hypothetical protein
MKRQPVQSEKIYQLFDGSYRIDRVLPSVDHSPARGSQRAQISLRFPEGLKTFVRSLAFGLPRHAADELVEHGEGCIG